MSAEEERGWDVSYRQRWWQQRLFACGNVTRKDAESTVLFMRGCGYRRIRLLASVTFPRGLYRGPRWWRSLNAWWLGWWGWCFYR